MSALTAISGASNSISLGGSALSLVGMSTALVKPKNPPPGTAGFVFDIKMTENVTMNAQVTDHFTEINSAIQDHVAIDPIKITLVGKVGELVHTKEAELAFASAALDRLAPITHMKPSQSAQAQKYISAADQAISATKSAMKAFSNLAGVFATEPAKNKQQKAFKTFENYFLGRTILTIETPWATYGSMLLENWSADQDEESIYETTYTLTFKQLRFVGTTVNTGNLSGRNGAQLSKAVDKGAQSGNVSAAANLYKWATGTK